MRGLVVPDSSDRNAGRGALLWLRTGPNYPVMSEHRWDPSCLRPERPRRSSAGRSVRRAWPDTRPGERPATIGSTSPGLYVPVEADETVVEQRILEQGSRITTYGAVTGWAALRWRGATYFDGTDGSGERLPVPLVVGTSGCRSDPRVAISRAQIAPTERTMVGDLWCTTVQRALFDEMRFAGGVRGAVVAMDMAAAARLISVRLMTRYVSLPPAWTGVRAGAQGAARWLLTTAVHRRRRGCAWSGSSTPACRRRSATCRCSTARAPARRSRTCSIRSPAWWGSTTEPTTRSSIADAPTMLARRGFRNDGLEYFDLVEGDLTDRLNVVRRMQETRERARFDPPELRRWTLTPPPWWRPREEPLDLHLTRTGEAALLIRT